MLGIPGTGTKRERFWCLKTADDTLVMSHQCCRNWKPKLYECKRDTGIKDFHAGAAVALALEVGIEVTAMYREDECPKKGREHGEVLGAL